MDIGHKIGLFIPRWLSFAIFVMFVMASTNGIAQIRSGEPGTNEADQAQQLAVPQGVPASAPAVGSFMVGDGPYWGDDIPTYSCLETCSMLFGGDANEYHCSTESDSINNLAWASAFGSGLHCEDGGGIPIDEDFKQGTHTDCGEEFCYISSYVQDWCGFLGEGTSENFCFSAGTVLDKELTSGPDADSDDEVDVVVPVKPGAALNYDFTITYDAPDSPPVLIVDTLPAEWIANTVEGMAVDVVDCADFDAADGDHGTVDIYKNGKPSKKCESATQIEWIPILGTTLTKSPDTDGWSPINSASGTYVYANSFVALSDGFPTELGMWLASTPDPGPSIRFEIWGDTGGLGPDPSNVLATTGSIAPSVTEDLEFYSAPVGAGAAALTAGSAYWFSATVVGEPAAAAYYSTGGHTQNSIYADNGTFWYSNDPAGLVFDGQGLTPEIAFEVVIGERSSLNVDSNTRQSPGKGHKTPVFAPTSCGALYLNHGAVALELDESGELVLDPDGNPIVAGGPTNSICLAAVSQQQYDAVVDYSAEGDHDEDGLSSYDEACNGVTDPCDPDTDDDGVLDYSDDCPLEGPPDSAAGELQYPDGCNYQPE